MSRNASLHPLLTLICVLGAGSPSSISQRRSRVSLGDCAPESMRLSAIRARRIPGVPRYRSATAKASAQVTPVAAANPSRCATALSRGRCRARSSAVRDTSSNGHVCDARDFVVADPLLVHDDAGATTSVLGDYFDWCRRIDPFRAVQGGGRSSRDDSFAAGPQPCRHCVEEHRRLGAIGDVDARVDCCVVPSEFAAGKAASDGFASDECL